MAFLSKVGNILRQAGRSEVSASSRPSIYQAIRCMSSSKVFVGGISYATDDTSLREAFSKYGEVVDAKVILDRETGRSRGFGFVSFTSGEEAATAIQGLDGKDLHGRIVRVNYANERAPRFGGGGGYGGGGYGSGGGGYGGGGGWGSGGGYDNNSGGGYGSYGGPGNYGGDNSAGRGGYGGNYGGGNSYDAANSGAFGSGAGSNGVAGGSGGNDSFGSGAGSYGVAGGTGGSDNLGSGSGYEGRDQFGADENIGSGDAVEGFGQEDALDSNYKEDNNGADDFAKRA